METEEHMILSSGVYTRQVGALFLHHDQDSRLADEATAWPKTVKIIPKWERKMALCDLCHKTSWHVAKGWFSISRSKTH